MFYQKPKSRIIRLFVQSQARAGAGRPVSTYSLLGPLVMGRLVQGYQELPGRDGTRLGLMCPAPPSFPHSGSL